MASRIYIAIYSYIMARSLKKNKHISGGGERGCIVVKLLLISTICCKIEYKMKELIVLANKASADKAITVRVDSATKTKAEKILNDIGINMTAYISSSLKALVRERRIPFAMVTDDYFTDRIILAKLSEAEKEASDPNTKWLTQDEVFGPIRKRFGYEV